MSTATRIAPTAATGPTSTPVADSRSRLARPGTRLALLGALALASCLAYFWWRLPLGSAFLVQRRLTTIATLAVVAVAIGVATVVFHTVTANRIVTPSIMGLDALYLALQTAAVFVWGTTPPDPVLRYLVVLAVMVGFSLALFGLVMGRLQASVTLTVLVGVLLGGLLRGISSFLQRLLDPAAFVILSDRFFADFTGAEPRLLAASAAIVAVACALLWRSRRELDVVALGRDVAIGLGVDHRRSSLRALLLVALLVGTATALVGPTMFFGLLVAHLAYRAVGSNRHAHTLPAVAACGLVALVGGQLLFERVLGLEGSLSMVVEFLGGIAFLVLVLRTNRETA